MFIARWLLCAEALSPSRAEENKEKVDYAGHGVERARSSHHEMARALALSLGPGAGPPINQRPFQLKSLGG
ncbi:uncharacterized protein PG986_013381 [Apiospora aurea]|uniref:Uncharacterized protein n=1 Tax=Apiospora aurea TaxID=335848 RepID=A0ABR1PVE6_9PEZI